MSNTKWYEDRGELIAFGKVLTGAGVDVWEYLSTPERWSDEHWAWLKLGRPDEVEELDDLDANTWDAIGRKRELERRYASVP